VQAIDPDKLKLFSFLLFTKLEGAVTSAMVHLGDHLSIYRTMASADAPMTTAQLAHATQLNERWIREWAYNQAAAKIISTINNPSESPAIVFEVKLVKALAGSVGISSYRKLVQPL
jgi:hypothetical protein